jgi:hypothetical protein
MTTNYGNNFNLKWDNYYPIPDPQILFINANTGFLIGDQNLRRSFNAGSSWEGVGLPNQSVLTNIAYSSNTNTVYICGYKHNNTDIPYLIKSSNGFISYDIIFDEINDPGILGIKQIIILNNNTNDIIYLNTKKWSLSITRYYG